MTGGFVVLQNTLQAMGEASAALWASLFRQAIIYIPMLFIMKSIMGCDGLIWAQPVCDVISIVIIAVMVIKKLKKTVWNG